MPPSSSGIRSGDWRERNSDRGKHRPYGPVLNSSFFRTFSPFPFLWGGGRHRMIKCSPLECSWYPNLVGMKRSSAPVRFRMAGMYYVPVKLKLQHPLPGNPPGIWTFEDWLVQIPSPWGKKAVQMPRPLVAFWKSYSLTKVKFYLVICQTLQKLDYEQSLFPLWDSRAKRTSEGASAKIACRIVAWHVILV